MSEATSTERPSSELAQGVAPRFAVVVPALNEVENIPFLVEALRDTFARHGLMGEVVLVDDGSTDGTAEAVTEAMRSWDRLKLVRHRRNLGKTEALLSALDATGAERLVLFDADLQHDADEIPRMLKKLDEGWDMVTGRKVGAYDKRLVSGVYNRLSRALFSAPVSDLNSMKAFRREILDEVHLRHDWHRFFVVLAYARGFSVTEIDITLRPRLRGRSKYGGPGRVLLGMLDLLAVVFFLSFDRRPLVLLGSAGFSLVTSGALVGIVAVVLRIEEWQPPFGLRPLLYLVMLLELMGFLLLGFGFVLEAIGQQRSELAWLRRRLERSTSGSAARR